MDVFIRTIGRPWPRAATLVLCGFILGVLAKPALAGDPLPDEFFEKTVRPILVNRCGECHGPTGKAKGGLRLATREAILKGGETGPAAVPGRPKESLLVEVIHYVEEPKMPPKGKLSDSDIETLTKWIQIGMPWPEGKAGKVVRTIDVPAGFKPTAEQREFWAFQPVRPVLLPVVKDAAWPRVDLDHFILAALEAKGLRPARAADRRVFVRRITYDLTGLPPTAEEVEAFVADASPRAEETLVDRLLASPRYGERWGRHWLDLVRYTDSFDARIAGSNNVLDVNDSWRYRDWVISSLNRDQPYDSFVTDQIAGDLVPAAVPGDVNVEGTIATGMLAIGNWGGGDADKEKLLTDIADDQVDVVSRAFMGVTIGCARCHDHKFDPFSTRDYYGLAGIFFSTHILPDVGPKTNGPPMLRIPLETLAEKAERERIARRSKELGLRLVESLTRAKTTLAQSLRPETTRYILAAREFAQPPVGRPTQSLAAFAQSRGLKPFALRQWATALGYWDESPLLTTPVRAVLGRAGVFGWRGQTDPPVVLINTTSEEVSLLTFKIPARSVTAHPGPSSAVAVSWTSPISGEVSVEGRVADTDPACGNGVNWSLDLQAIGRARNLATGVLANGGAQELLPTAGEKLTSIRVAAGDRIRLMIAPKEDHTCDMTHVSLTVRSVAPPAEWNLAADLVPDPVAGNPHADRLGHRDVWSFSEIASPSRPSASDPTLASLMTLLADPKADPKTIEAAARKFQDDFKRLDPSNPFWVRSPEDEREFPEPHRQVIAEIRAERDALMKNPGPPARFANGAQDGGVPGSPHAGVHDVKVHVRGSYARLGDLVPRHFPAILDGEQQPPITTGSGRLDLARWMTSPQHPLTARVMVNRIWQNHFGSGIVRTPGNFGKLGERPTHPELLDHLARRFVELGWSLKKMHREMLLSSTYRQSSEGDPATLAADPENRLFGRMNRRRLDAESIRDSLLAASGKIDLTAGGPAERDPSSRRRSVYLMTIRSDRTGFGPLFDAADSTSMIDVRTVSTVAPQALYLLNNRFVLDVADSLARRLDTLRPGDDDAKIDRAYALLFGRPPTAEERRIGREVVADLARVGGDNSWASYCHVLLCSNEWIYLD